MSASADLSVLRQQMRKARRQLTEAAQRHAQQRLLERVRHLPWYRNALNRGFYVADDGEIDPAVLIAESSRHAHACFLPVLPTYATNIGTNIGTNSATNSHVTTMHFARYDAATPLVPRRFGIPAPRAAGLAGWRLDVVFVPLVAFDRAGRRLGRGAGFYDRAFALRPGRPRPWLVGLAHAFQEVSALPDRDHDVRLDIIVTPNELIQARLLNSSL